MKSLALYIDKWYIVGAVCADGTTSPIQLPNKEDRLWLFFYEDDINNTISYGKSFESHYRNRENHYYGDIFTKITESSATFTLYNCPQPIKDIFKCGKVFETLKAAINDEDNITTYLSFSKDITPAARLIFINELQQLQFQIKESVARIDHLALEYAIRENDFNSKDYYLVLNACNENLHYSIYKKSDNIFLRIAENMLIGKGTDVRKRCLIEHVVNTINQIELILQAEDKEPEYLRCLRFVDGWLSKFSNANKSNIPIPINNISFSKDPYYTWSIIVKKETIEAQTKYVVGGIVNAIVNFVQDQGISHEQMGGIIYLGNTFTNEEFTSQFCQKYNLAENGVICYKDIDLPSLVAVYNFIDCSQFKKIEEEFTTNAEDELLRIKIAQEEKKANENAQKKVKKQAKKEQIKEAKEASFSEAMDKGYDSESKHDYDSMIEYFKIAKKLSPNNEEANIKYEEALRLKSEQNFKFKSFVNNLQQAKTALDEKDFETAKYKAEEALNLNSTSNEALAIKDEANRQIKQRKEFDRHIERSEIFIVQKLFKEATEELDKARLLNVDNALVKTQLKKIQDNQKTSQSKINKLVAKLNKELSANNYTEALLVCGKLQVEDATNQIVWSNKYTEITLLQKEEKERDEIIEKLKYEIDIAQIHERWEQVIDKCNELLDITPDDDNIKQQLTTANSNLKKAEKKVIIEKEIVNIKDLILSGDLKEAKTKLDVLAKKRLDSQRSQIRELRKLLFAYEEKFESEQTLKSEPTKTNRSANNAFFETSPLKQEIKKQKQGSSQQKQEKKSAQNKDNFFEGKITKGEKSSKVSKKTMENVDDFFNS